MIPEARMGDSAFPENIPKKIYYHSLGEFLLPIPCRQRVYSPGNVGRLGKSQEASCDEEACSVPHEDLERGDDAKRDDLSRYPLTRPNLWFDVNLEAL